MHVTYWDQLGWKDPASLAEATARQQDLRPRLRRDRIYTPQAVIDGRDELVGSDEAASTRAIATRRAAAARDAVGLAGPSRASTHRADARSRRCRPT